MPRRWSSNGRSSIKDAARNLVLPEPYQHCKGAVPFRQVAANGQFRGIVNSGCGNNVYKSESKPERDGEDVATPLNLQFSFADRAAVNPPVSRDCSDEELVCAAQLGNRAAFGFLYERYARMVHGILLGRVPQPAVEDLVQDVFLRAMPRISSLREKDHFGGWLAAIVRNCATDYFRQSRQVDSLEEDALEEKSPSKGGGSDLAEAHAVLATIRTLPEAYREPLILRLVEGMTGPEIAERTGLTHGSVRVNLHRGMQQLREILRGAKASEEVRTKL
jgi:RNA polymerase sigma-70 factor (ECF subfamily)